MTKKKMNKTYHVTEKEINECKQFIGGKKSFLTSDLTNYLANEKHVPRKIMVYDHWGERYIDPAQLAAEKIVEDLHVEEKIFVNHKEAWQWSVMGVSNKVKC